MENKNSLGFKFLLRALHHRNYRLFFYGQNISLIGTWMQGIAVSWLVYRLTQSAFLLGLVSFAGQVPTFLFAPFCGVLADRWNRHRILLITQTLAMVQAVVLALLTFTGNIIVWQIMVLSMLLGLINAFDMPTRQSFVVEMIDKREDLGNAIALNSLMINISRMIGPAIAGIIVATLGEGVCFLLNGLSYLAIIFVLLKMNIRRKIIQKPQNHILQDLKEGFIYTFGFASMRHILFLFSLVNLMGVASSVLMPVFAKEILGGGSHTLGFLMAATGVGALAGSFYVASRATDKLTKVIPYAAIIFGLALIAFSFSRILWLSMGLMPIAGFGMIVLITSSNTMLQTLTDDSKRGRVMSFYTMAFLGMATFGSLWAGWLAGKIGAANTLSINGIICVLGTFFFKNKTINTSLIKIRQKSQVIELSVPAK